MKRGLLLLCGAFLLAAGAARSQEAPVQEDMRFVEALRKQGKSDLALEYLQRLAKNPSPELAKELPLELAKTRLKVAEEEPDSGKRLNLYAGAREEFQMWVQANPGHPRVAEVKLDIAQTAVLQGRTQLSQALMNPDFDEVMVAEAFKARAMLEDAGVQIQQAAKDLDAQITKLGEPKTPAEKDLKKKLDNDRLRADLTLALNQFDLAMTYPRNAKDTALLTDRGLKVQAAEKAFEKIGAKDDTNPICWVAKAWAGRCFHEGGDLPEARKRFNEVIKAPKNYADEGQRLARYFRLLVIQEKPDPKEDDAYMVKDAEDWIHDYGGHLKEPEAYGLRYLLAKEHALVAANEKDAAAKAVHLNEARKQLRAVEQSENDFTDRARRLKIQIIASQQGGFTEPVPKLKTFEDCYVRAQYELMEQEKDDKEAKPDEAEKKHKAHDAVITEALERGIKLAQEAKPKTDDPLEVGAARSILAFEYMNSMQYRESIAVAEPFARSDPRSAQAETAAVYALQSYASMIQADEEAGKADDVKANRDKLQAFAAWTEKTWPREAPGDKARHLLALLYVNDKDPDRHEENVQQAVLALGRISPSYSNYAMSQYQLAQYCLAADKERLKPLPGDGDDGFRKRALAALETVPPPPPGADATTNKAYFLAKILLAQQDFPLKKYDEMEQLTATLMPLLPTVALDPDPATNVKLHADYEESIKTFRVFARYGKADAEYKAAEKAEAKDKPAHYAKIMELLDPLVDEIAAKQHPELKNNPSLGRGILDNDLRATIQLNKLDRTQVVLNGYKELAAGDSPDAGAAEVLKQLTAFIPPQLEELKRKNDPGLDAAKTKFGAILADTLKPLQGDKLTPKLIYLTARIYSSLDKHKDAAELLEKVQEPAKDAPPSDTDLYQQVRVQLIRERRLNGETDEARKLMKEILGDPPAKPGWGAKKIDALMENVELLAAEGKNKAAAEYANGLVQKLLPRIDADNKIKEVYLQCYYLVVENVYRQAVKLKDKAPDKYPAEVRTAAMLAVQLAKKQTGFVTDATRARFHDLIEPEPDLKDAFLDSYMTTVETAEKDAAAMKDAGQREKAMADVAALIVELEKMWPDYGSDAAKNRATTLLGSNADLKAAYDRLKGTAP